MIWVERLICIALILQTFELLALPPWPWTIVQNELPKALKPLLKFYRALLLLRLLCAGAGLFFISPWWTGGQLLTTWLIAIRWRGTFNGGSDTMTFQILLACLLYSLSRDLERAALLYICVQVILSYFVAGLAKIRQPEWRSGQALATFLGRTPARLPVLSWAVIVFECLFPLSVFFSATLCISTLFLGILFHLANFYFFGLNRFVFVWAAGYPALFLAALSFS